MSYRLCSLCERAYENTGDAALGHHEGRLRDDERRPRRRAVTTRQSSTCPTADATRTIRRGVPTVNQTQHGPDSSMNPAPSRRTVLKVAGCGLIGSGLLGHATASPGNDDAPFHAQRRAVTRATDKYSDIGKALADGFEIMGPYVPDMGLHLTNFDRIDKAVHRGINIRKPQGLTYNLDGELGSVEYIVPLDEAPPDVYNDENEELKPSEAHGWHPHHSAQHVFANGNGVVDDRSTIGVDELLHPDNWAELSDENDLFQPEVPGLSAGDKLTVNWGHQPGDDPETRIVDFVIGPHRDWWTLHAWFHFHNPGGVFSSFNHDPNWD